MLRRHRRGQKSVMTPYRSFQTTIIMSSPSMQTAGGGILWSCISRNATIVVEAGEDTTANKSVTKLAQKLMTMKPTAGWEYANIGRLSSSLRGIKFHVYDNDDFTDEQFIWMFCCVYDEKTCERVQAQSFLEKLVILTERQRSQDYDWRHGTAVLAGQAEFAPILLQRMQEVSYYGKMAMVSQKVESCKQVMSHNIEMILEREDKLQKMDEDATRLQEMAQHFKKGTRRIRRFKMWQNAKHGIVVGTAVTAGIAIVVVPPLIALL
jgi:hypothetical protein